MGSGVITKKLNQMLLFLLFASLISLSGIFMIIVERNLAKIVGILDGYLEGIEITYIFVIYGLYFVKHINYIVGL